MTEFKGPIVEGAYYLCENRRIVGPAFLSTSGVMCFNVGRATRAEDTYMRAENLSLTRRVYITHTDPAEVVAELRQLETGIRFRAGASEDGGEYGGALANGVREAADLVAEKLVGGK